ncbi:MAG: response regulator [Bacteroidetes bacterium]|mgnify:CR=1 FL=1|nr:response regulator [Bacteroidota bacterium]
MPGFPIMIVDDDQIYSYMANKMIMATGLAGKITIHQNGAEAWDFLQSILKAHEVLPKIIFLDINMPNMNGWEFLFKICPLLKKTGEKTRVYLVSSSQDENDLEQSRKFDCVFGYLVKPVLSHTFHEILASNH